MMRLPQQWTNLRMSRSHSKSARRRARGTTTTSLMSLTKSLAIVQSHRAYPQHRLHRARNQLLQLSPLLLQLLRPPLRCRQSASAVTRRTGRHCRRQLRGRPRRQQRQLKRRHKRLDWQHRPSARRLSSRSARPHLAATVPRPCRRPRRRVLPRGRTTTMQHHARYAQRFCRALMSARTTNHHHHHPTPTAVCLPTLLKNPTPCARLAEHVCHL
jgi:hypothetical protein